MANLVEPTEEDHKVLNICWIKDFIFGLIPRTPLTRKKIITKLYQKHLRVKSGSLMYEILQICLVFAEFQIFHIQMIFTSCLKVL